MGVRPAQRTAGRAVIQSVTFSVVVEVRAGDLFSVAMGSGDDNLNLTGVSGRVLAADGGADFDRLTTLLLTSTQEPTFTNWEVIDGSVLALKADLAEPVNQR